MHEREDIEGECTARLFLGDDLGDGTCTCKCSLPEGHEGIHIERFTRTTYPKRLRSRCEITWEHDEQTTCARCDQLTGHDDDDLCKPCASVVYKQGRAAYKATCLCPYTHRCPAYHWRQGWKHAMWEEQRKCKEAKNVD